MVTDQETTKTHIISNIIHNEWMNEWILLEFACKTKLPGSRDRSPPSSPPPPPHFNCSWRRCQDFLGVFTIILIKLLIKTVWLKCSRYLLMKCVVIWYNYFIRNYQVWKYMWSSGALRKASTFSFFSKKRERKKRKIKSYSASIDLLPAAFPCWRLSVGCWFWLTSFLFLFLFFL